MEADALVTPDELTEEWRDLLKAIPGYDPFRESDGMKFSPKKAKDAIDFFPMCLKHVEGKMAGKPFILQRWQQAIVANLFGWQVFDENQEWVRRYREALIYVARKNGKTPLSAGIALYVLFLDGEKGQQDYIAAGDREQAGMLFRQAKGMVEQEPRLMKRCRILGGTSNQWASKSIVREDEGSFLRVISSDAHTKHGGTTHLGIIDELHVQPNRDLYDVLRTSTASANRKQPLLLWITTADYSRESICNEVHDRACKVRDGALSDPRFLPVIYELDREDDWTSEAAWEKANPNIDISVSRDYLRRECAKAQQEPGYENTFKRLHLNIKTEQDCRVIPMDQWEACGQNEEDEPEKPEEWRTRKLEELKGAKCNAGLDLGSVSDLTCLALLFGNDTDGYDVIPFFWTPEDNAHKRERKDGVPYLTWTRQGYMTMTDGNETDYQKVRREIGALADNYGIQTIAADRLFQGAQLCQDLIRDGLNVVKFGQGYFSMAAPTRRFLELVAAGKLRHGNNPVLKWMASNAATEDERGDGAILKFSKRKSSEKIDGIIATTMALGIAMSDPGDQTLRAYDSPGGFSL